ncbi:MAG: hypothetical protein HXY44_10505 [Syntrophaceae bacterium]|nr:hypothetical protein [Syntrophaceae bacterium]
MDKRRLFLTVPLILMLACSYVNGKQFDTFRWLTEEEDKETLIKISQVFTDELKPDDPAKIGPRLPYLYKYIYKVGVFRSTALVIIGHRENKDHDTGDLFLSFNCDLSTNEKSRIQTSQMMWVWRLYNLVYFEFALTPDIVFEYQNCTECEASRYISSFQYDRRNKKWKVRSWGEDGDAIFIGSDPEIGVETRIYDCLHKIQDFDSDGFRDIAVRCRITGTETHSVIDTTIVYTIRSGSPQKRKIQEKKQLLKIQSTLCEGQSGHPLCK